VVHLRLPDEEMEHVGGGERGQREDDTEQSVRSRLRRHEAMVGPTARHYAEQGLLVTVDAVGTPAEIAVRMLTALDRRGDRPQPDGG
jgi:adenylate kinase